MQEQKHCRVRNHGSIAEVRVGEGGLRAWGHSRRIWGATGRSEDSLHGEPRKVLCRGEKGYIRALGSPPPRLCVEGGFFGVEGQAKGLGCRGLG